MGPLDFDNYVILDLLNAHANQINREIKPSGVGDVVVAAFFNVVKLAMGSSVAQGLEAHFAEHFVCSSKLRGYCFFRNLIGSEWVYCFRSSD